MKVIHTLFAYDSDRFRGGVTKAVADLAAAQAAIGLDVEIWAPHRGADLLVSSREGVTVRQFPGRPFGKITWSPALGAALLRVPRGSVLHSHSIFDPVNWQTARAARRSRLPLFAHCHGAVAPELMGTLQPKAVKKRTYSYLVEIPNLNSANAVIALTDAERERIAACKVRSRIQVVPNGVVLPAAGDRSSGELRTALGIARSDLVILYLGRINPIKQIEHIIDAFDQASRGNGRLHLVIAGSATTAQQYYRDLQAHAGALACAPRVHWIGHVVEADKRAVFEAADFFVHASRSEGMSMAILEAMSFGKCVVATVGCQMAPAAQEDALVEVADGAAPLAAAFSSLAGDEARRREVGERARDYVARRHDWKVISQQMAVMYKQAAGDLA